MGWVQAGAGGQGHTAGIAALAHKLFWTWDLDLVWEAPSPSFWAEFSPLEESLYFSETEIDPEMSKVLFATWQL